MTARRANLTVLESKKRLENIDTKVFDKQRLLGLDCLPRMQAGVGQYRKNTAKKCIILKNDMYVL